MEELEFKKLVDRLYFDAETRLLIAFDPYDTEIYDFAARKTLEYFDGAAQLTLFNRVLRIDGFAGLPFLWDLVERKKVEFYESVEDFTARKCNSTDLSAIANERNIKIYSHRQRAFIGDIGLLHFERRVFRTQETSSSLLFFAKGNTPVGSFPKSFMSYAFSPNGNCVAIMHADKTGANVSVMNLANGEGFQPRTIRVKGITDHVSWDTNNRIFAVTRQIDDKFSFVTVIDGHPDGASQFETDK